MAYVTETTHAERGTRVAPRWIGDFIRAHRRRRGFRKLLDLDDHLLDDMGVTRAEVTLAASLPTAVNAANELRRMSNERRRMRM